jgi:wobble nucleotide-excising tRNase
MKDHSSLVGRTVVLDDPVDSFGTLRLRAVRLAIRDLCARGAQVVILTHDDRLAAMVWRDSARHAMSKKTFAALEMVEQKDGALLRRWDVENATRGQYFNDYAALEDLLDDKINVAVGARSIRPYLEQRIRYQYPGTTLSSRDNLGDMIGKIKNASRGSRLKELEPKLRDLEELNDASLPSHHASDDVPDMPLPGRSEIRRYAKMALSVC